jgi:hypothetical protein
LFARRGESVVIPHPFRSASEPWIERNPRLSKRQGWHSASSGPKCRGCGAEKVGVFAYSAAKKIDRGSTTLSDPERMVVQIATSGVEPREVLGPRHNEKAGDDFLHHRVDLRKRERDVGPSSPFALQKDVRDRTEHDVMLPAGKVRPSK